MPRYIDAIEAKAAIKDLFADMPRIDFMDNRDRWRKENEQYLLCLDVLSSLPTADVVERKVGEWKVANLLKGKMKYCSVCGFGQYISDERRYDYCPSCGARMKGEDDGSLHSCV